MLVLLEPGVTEAVANDIATRLRMLGLSVHRTEFEGRVRLGAVGDGVPVDWDQATNTVTPLANPNQPLNSEDEVRSEIAAALRRLG